jgi:hypothetical protein
MLADGAMKRQCELSNNAFKSKGLRCKKCGARRLLAAGALGTSDEEAVQEEEEVEEADEEEDKEANEEEGGEKGENAKGEKTNSEVQAVGASGKGEGLWAAAEARAAAVHASAVAAAGAESKAARGNAPPTTVPYTDAAAGAAVDTDKKNAAMDETRAAVDAGFAAATDYEARLRL